MRPSVVWIILCCVYASNGKSLEKGRHSNRHGHLLTRPLHITPGAHYIDDAPSPGPNKLAKAHSVGHGNLHTTHRGIYSPASNGLGDVGKENFATKGDDKYSNNFAANEKNTKLLQDDMQGFRQELATDSSSFSQPFVTNGLPGDYQVIKTGLEGQTKNVVVGNRNPLQGIGTLEGGALQRQSTPLVFANGQPTVLQAQSNPLTGAAEALQAQGNSLMGPSEALQAQSNPLTVSAAALQAQGNSLMGESDVLQVNSPLTGATALQAQDTNDVLQVKSSPLSGKALVLPAQDSPLTTALQAPMNPLAASALQAQAAGLAGEVLGTRISPLGMALGGQQMFLNPVNGPGQQMLGANAAFSSTAWNPAIPKLTGVSGLARNAAPFSLSIDGYRSSFLKPPGQQLFNFNANDALVTVSKKTQITQHGKASQTTQITEHGKAPQRTRITRHGKASQKTRATQHGKAAQKTRIARHGKASPEDTGHPARQGFSED